MRLRSVVQIGSAWLGGVILIALAALSSGPGIAAQPTETAAVPQISFESVASDGLSIAHLDDGGHKVYFRNTSDGVLTLTLGVSGTLPLTLTAGPVFDTVHEMTATTAPWTPTLTYTVFTTHTGEVAARYLVTQTASITASLWVTFIQDLVPPTVTLAISGSDFVNQTGVSVALSAGDNASGLEQVCLSETNGVCPGPAIGMTGLFNASVQPFTLSAGDGNKVIYAGAWDQVANESAWASDTVFLDTAAPAVTVTATWLMTDAITVAWSGDDPAPASGTVSYTVERRVADGAWESWLPSVTTTEAVLDADIALPYTFRVTAFDRAGNSAVATDALAPKVPPSLTFESATAEDLLIADTLLAGTRTVYFDNSTPGTLTVTLGVSGTLPLDLSADEVFGTGYDLPVPITPWTTGLRYTVTTAHQSQSGVQVQVIHNPGTTADLLLDFVRDVTSPTVAYGSPPVATSSVSVYVSSVGPHMYYGRLGSSVPLLIQGTAADTGSGLVEPVTANAVFGGAPPALIGDASNWSFAYGLPRNYTQNGAFVVTAQDLLGHTGTAELPFTHDGTPPTVTVEIPGSGFVKDPSVTLALAAGDDVSGLDHLCISMSPSGCGQEVALSGAVDAVDTPVVLTGGDGEKTVWAKAWDKVQNSSGWVSDLVFLDTVSPTVVVTATWPGDADEMAVVWSSSDPAPGSGVVSYTVETRAGDGDWQVRYASTQLTAATLAAAGNLSHTVRVTAFDRAGNLRAGLDLLPEKGAPSISLVSVTAHNLLVANTGGADQHTVYFDNTQTGTLTVTVDIDGELPLLLAAEPAFGTPYVLPAPALPWSPDLVYAVLSAHVSQPDVAYTVSHLGKSSRLFIDFIRDVTAPDVRYAVSPVVETSPFIYVPAGPPRMYYGPVDTSTFFTVRGTATDAGSGLDDAVTATPAFGTAAPANIGTLNNWAFQYQIRPGDAVDGQIVVRAQDLLGHATPAALTYTYDGQAPAVVVTATRLTPTSVQVQWSATDGEGAGVEAYSVRINGVLVIPETQNTSYTSNTMPNTGSYEIVITAVDRVGNAGSGTALDGSNQVYLPFLGRNYATLTNGTFDSGLNGWTRAGAGFAWQGQTYGSVGLSVAPVTGLEGGAAVLLGNPAYTNAAIPVGYGSLNQSFVVEQDKVRIEYHIFSYDIIRGTGDLYFDTFEVVVDDTPLTGDDRVPGDAERVIVCQPGPAFNPTGGVVTVTKPGLAVCGGRAGTGDDVGTPWGPSKHTVTLDLSKYRGQLINLSFSIWSREYDETARNDHGWYNTYAYVNDVRYVP